MKMPPMVPVQSSNVAALGHSVDGLFVAFKGGATYRYPDAPHELYRQGLAAASPGTWFRESVRGRFEYEKVVAGDAKP